MAKRYAPLHDANKNLIYLILKILKKIALRICLHPKVSKMEKSKGHKS